MPMKKYRFKYSPYVYLTCSLVLALALATIIWNVFNIVQLSDLGTFKIVGFALLIAIGIFLAVFTLAVLIRACYVISNEQIIACFGFVKSRNNVKDIIGITHFKKTNKLVVYFKDGKYAVIVINPEEYDSFAEDVRKINNHILYEQNNQESI